ncbi:MAG: hypothetical protein E7Y34_02270 [Mycoplasma sp.]|nr:hypothetical protein [Mycoplasma sp.]
MSNHKLTIWSENKKLTWKQIEKQNKYWYKLYRWLNDKMFFFQWKDEIYKDYIVGGVWYKVNVNITDNDQVIISKWVETTPHSDDYKRLSMNIIDLKQLAEIKRVVKKYIESIIGDKCKLEK